MNLVNTQTTVLKHIKNVLLCMFVLALGALGGCASMAPPGAPNPPPLKESPFNLLPILDLRDPFEPFNRKVTEFNDAADRAVLKPVAETYRDAVPAIVRTGVNNFFSNYWDLWSAGNAFLQLEPAAGFDNLLRFGFNTTFGFYGIFDIAGEAGIERHRKDLGQTLARWGVRSGPYLVLPLFGPTTLRDAAVSTIETRGELIRTFDSSDKRNLLYTLQAVNRRTNLLRASAALDDAALDKYTFTRDVYLQLRNNEIWDGSPPEEKDKDDKNAAPATEPKPGKQ